MKIGEVKATRKQWESGWASRVAQWQSVFPVHWLMLASTVTSHPLGHHSQAGSPHSLLSLPILLHYSRTASLPTRSLLAIPLNTTDPLCFVTLLLPALHCCITSARSAQTLTELLCWRTPRTPFHVIRHFCMQQDAPTTPETPVSCDVAVSL